MDVAATDEISIFVRTNSNTDDGQADVTHMLKRMTDW